MTTNKQENLSWKERNLSYLMESFTTRIQSFQVCGVLLYPRRCDQPYWKNLMQVALQATLENTIYQQVCKMYCWEGVRAKVRRYCQACLTCTTRKGTGRRSRPPLQPILVCSPFHRVVDVLQLPLTFDGNHYLVVFIDYLTKWVEAFAVSDQNADNCPPVGGERGLSPWSSRRATL